MTFHAFGSVLKIGNAASPEVFTAVAGLRVLRPGAFTTDVVGSTDHDSPNAHREKIPGIKDTGAFGFSGNLMPGNATQQDTGTGLMKLWKDRTVFNFQLVAVDDDDTTWEYNGFISNLQLGEFDAEANTAVQISGEITLSTQATLPTP